MKNEGGISPHIASREVPRTGSPEEREIGPYRVRSHISAEFRGAMLDLLERRFQPRMAFIIDPERLEIYLGEHHEDILGRFSLGDGFETEDNKLRAGWIKLKRGKPLETIDESGTLKVVSTAESAVAKDILEQYLRDQMPELL